MYEVKSFKMLLKPEVKKVRCDPDTLEHLIVLQYLITYVTSTKLLTSFVRNSVVFHSKNQGNCIFPRNIE